jgi:DNA-binding transcriptional LysR family regulator
MAFASESDARRGSGPRPGRDAAVRSYSARMDRITGIELFTRVVETGSFSKAAEELRIAQPTATKQVAALEKRLGARLLHRSTRGASPTEVGQRYYEKCKAVLRDLEEADSVAQSVGAGMAGLLRISTSVAFGRRVLTPMVLDFMAEHPLLQVDLNFDDRYVSLVEQGVDVAIRLGRLADSALGARRLGANPWLLVAAPAYLARHGEPDRPQALAEHECLVYSSVMGDDRWRFMAAGDDALLVPVRGRLRSNNLSTLLAACRAGMGIAALPGYVARDAVADGSLRRLLAAHPLPAQEINAVFPSPRQVPAKVRGLVDFLQTRFADDWAC